MREQVMHPEGKILLLNGKAIDAYEKPGKGVVPEYRGMQLDASGEYLQIEGGHRKRTWPKPSPDPAASRLRKMFTDNAIGLYRMRDMIYSDSRMFLSHVDMGCHLAYFGTSGFAGATLGVWLEWWDSLQECREDENGNERLITLFSGSPLSGMHSCCAVLPSGDSCSGIRLKNFTACYRKFMEINSRYYGLSEKYVAWPLEKCLAECGRISSKLWYLSGEKSRHLNHLGTRKY